MEFEIVEGALSRLTLQLSLLQETVESLESSMSADILSMDQELKELKPRVEVEWAAADAEHVEDEDREPSDVEIRYLELEQATWARQQHVEILRVALFLATYATFEQCLAEFAHEWREKRAFSLKPGDLRHRGVEGSQAYLTKVVGMPFPSDSSEWRQVQHLRSIRNQLAHEGPTLSDSPDSRLRAAFATFPGVFSEDRGKISLSAEFLKASFRTFGTFTRSLITRNIAFSDQRPKLVP